MYNNISALQALGIKMAVSANNIANVESEGFKKSRAVLGEGRTPGSVQVDIDQIDTPGALVFKDTGAIAPTELSNVDLAEELALTIPTRRNYEANLKMIKSLDDMLGSIIDILG